MAVEVHLQVFALMCYDGPCASGVGGEVLRPERGLDHTTIRMNDSTTSWGKQQQVREMFTQLLSVPALNGCLLL